MMIHHQLSLAWRTHRRTETMLDAVQDFVAAGLDQRPGQGQRGVMPMLEK
jgi:hypothetical protein